MIVFCAAGYSNGGRNGVSYIVVGSMDPAPVIDWTIGASTSVPGFGMSTGAASA